MSRITQATAALRGIMSLTRGNLKKADDKHLLQEVRVGMFDNDSISVAERFQQYGFTCVPLPEKDDKDEKTAEVLVAFVGGDRDHAVIISVDDRRYRLKLLKEGETALYDDQGHQVHIHRDGITVSAP